MHLASLLVVEENLSLIPGSPVALGTPRWRWHVCVPSPTRPTWDTSLMRVIRHTSLSRGSLNPLDSRSRFSSLSLSCFYPGKVLLSMHALFQLNPFPHYYQPTLSHLGPTMSNDKSLQRSTSFFFQWCCGSASWLQLLRCDLHLLQMCLSPTAAQLDSDKCWGLVEFD